MKWIEVADEENWNQVRQIFELSAEKLRHNMFFARSCFHPHQTCPSTH